MSAREQRKAELLAARDAIDARIAAMEPRPEPVLDPALEAWKATPLGALLYADATARLAHIPHDSPRTLARRRKAIA